MVRPFEGIFGNTCELRLIEFMLPLDDMYFNVSELAEEAGVSRTTAGKIAKKFMDWGIFRATNTSIKTYSLNKASPIIQAIDKMNDALIERMLGEEQVGEITDYFNNSYVKDSNEKSVTSVPDEYHKILFKNNIESPYIDVYEPNIKLQPNSSKRKITPIKPRRKPIIQ